MKRLYPPEPEIKPEEGFTQENDIFGYQEFGENLANLVQNIEQPLVLALDGPWGSGKSVFVRQWAGLLRQRGLPVIEFDAFRNDHHGDAFVALSGEIAALAAERLKDQPKPYDSYISSAAKVGRALTPVGTRMVIRMLTAGLLSGDDVADAKVILSGSMDDMASVVEDAVRERLTNAEADRRAMTNFQRSLQDLAGKLVQQTLVRKKRRGDSDEADMQLAPLVFIIDELDRCRPLFALDILERVKHVLSVQGTVFLLVMNTQQMEAVVHSEYGLADTEAESYLRKFYHLQVMLQPKSNDIGKSVSSKAFIPHLWTKMGIQVGEGEQDKDIQDDLTLYSEIYDLSLREMERALAHVALLGAALPPKNVIIPPLIAGLSVMRLKRRNLYKKAAAGKLTWQDATSFIQGIKNYEGMHVDYHENIWRVVTETNDNVQKYHEETRWLRQAYGVSVGTRFSFFVPFYCKFFDLAELHF